MGALAILLDEDTEQGENDLLPLGPEMSLNNNDRNWINDRIQAATEAQTKKVDDRIDSFSKKGHPAVKVLKEWGVLGVAIVGLFSYLTTDIAFRTHTNDRLDTIESNLRIVQASSAPRSVLTQLADLPPKALSKNLSALRKVAEQPVSSVRPTPAELNSVRKNLLQVKDSAPDYWPALLQYVQFASRASSQAPPPGGFISEVSNIHSNGPGGIGFPENATIQLSGVIEGVVFRNDRIIITPNTVLRNVRFINCAFEFGGGVEDAPSSVKDTGHMLLASGFENAYISGM